MGLDHGTGRIGGPLDGMCVPPQPEDRKHNNIKRIYFFRETPSQRLKMDGYNN